MCNRVASSQQNNTGEMTLSMQESFERCCRLCAEVQDVTIMIFSEEAKAMLLQNKLNKYLLIEVDEDDRLPKNICIRCCTTLQTVCDFIDTARKAQDILSSQSILLDQCELNIKKEIQEESDIQDEAQITEIEVNVDPMMVLQNSGHVTNDQENSSNSNFSEDIYLRGVTCEDVTIKLIKKGTANDKNANDNMVDDEDDTNEDTMEPKIDKPFPCITCKRSFLTDLALKNHSWVHINNENINKRYKCNTCVESFDFKYDLIAHVKSHRMSGACKICGRCFRSERNLDAHMAAHSIVGKSYTCKVCGRSYKTLSNLKTHSVTHSNHRPFKCHLCKKSFKRNQDLKFHINQHTGAKPYKCPFCDKAFASSGNCYSHRSRMHPGSRTDNKVQTVNNHIQENQQTQGFLSSKSPLVSMKGIFKYQCQHCNHSFMKRDNYMYHMFQHTGQKPFQCKFCTEQFVTRRGLLLHHNQHHPIKDRPLTLISKNTLLK